ncbi:MAG: alanine--tRNA ligase [candidate division WWE3 bacterium]|nr:alanine--tRNA ligase [candidate division WWE3 bacterium]
MTSSELRQKYLDFFVSRGHKIIPSASLVPENDPTTLFTSAGMQPMIPYLLGDNHPLGTRLVDSQKCFRTQDIDEVGDSRHNTFFEMLGNWSLGDYFKKEQLTWLYELLTNELQIPVDRLYVSVFEGNDLIPKDEETASIWKSLGIPENHIYFYGVEKNWWSRSGTPDQMPVGEPGGPDSEIFFEFPNVPHNPKYGEHCHPNCDCGRFLEFGNSVFMTYKKTERGFEPLIQRNIDFGGGLERLLAVVNDNPDVFQSDLFTNITAVAASTCGASNGRDIKSDCQIIADHLKAAVFLIADGVRPDNKLQGYFLRRLMRRAMVKMQKMSGKTSDILTDNVYNSVVTAVFETYGSTDYFKNTTVENILAVVLEERDRFGKTLNLGLSKIGQISPFDLYQSYGFPIEVTEEIYQEKGLVLDKESFNKDLKAHQEQSRTASAGMFKSGLVDESVQVVKYHTATHLLHEALRQVLGKDVNQKGSNITSERLRFDFSYPQKVEALVLQKVEDIVNQKIKEALPVKFSVMSPDEARSLGATLLFETKYGDQVKVYQIGDFSVEACTGPHVTNISELGHFKIVKEEAVSAGVRRIKAVLD